MALFILIAVFAMAEEHAAHYERLFASAATLPEFKCGFKPVAPALTYGLHFDAGYQLQFPLNQFQGTGHGLDVLLRVTPQSGAAKLHYFENHYDMPPVPDTDATGEVKAHFPLPPGRYRVESLAWDETPRVCRGEWSVEIKPEPGDQRPAPLNRLTVFLDAAPHDPRASKMDDADIEVLTSSLGALLERLPARAVRLVVFNVDQEAELFRANVFDPHAMEQVSKALGSVQLATVDYKNLQNRKGPAEYIAGLINGELREGERSDAAIFLGWLTRSRETASPGVGASEKGPKFFYVEYRSTLAGDSARPAPRYASRSPRGFGMPPGMAVARAEAPDTIESTMQRVQGRTMLVLAPKDFAHALAEIRGRVGK